MVCWGSGWGWLRGCAQVRKAQAARQAARRRPATTARRPPPAARRTSAPNGPSLAPSQALATAPFALLRLPSMVLYCIKTRAASTERAKARLWQDQFQSYGGPVPRASLVALLGLVFAPINPLVPPL